MFDFFGHLQGYGIALQMSRQNAQQHELSQAQANAYRNNLQAMYAQAGLYSSQPVAQPKPKEDGNCTQCGAKSFRLTSDHGNWKHICSYCGSDK